MYSRFRQLSWLRLIASSHPQIAVPPPRKAQDRLAVVPFAASLQSGQEPELIAAPATVPIPRNRLFRWLCTLVVAVSAVQTLRDQQLGALAATARQLAVRALREAGQTARMPIRAQIKFRGKEAKAMLASSTLGREYEPRRYSATLHSGTLSSAAHSPAPHSPRGPRTPMELSTGSGHSRSERSTGRGAAQPLSASTARTRHDAVSFVAPVVPSMLTDSASAVFNGGISLLPPEPEDLVSLTNVFLRGDGAEIALLPLNGRSLTSDAVLDDLEAEQPEDALTPVAAVEVAVADSWARPLANAWSADLLLPVANTAPPGNGALLAVAQTPGLSMPANTVPPEISSLLTAPDLRLSDPASPFDAGHDPSAIPHPEPSSFLLLVVGSSSLFVLQRWRKRSRPASEASIA